MRRTIFRKLHSGNPGIVIACVFAVLIPSLIAQTAGMGVLKGKVTDASGGVVANATVTATSVDTGQTQSVTTGPDGTYKFDGLPPGNYRLKFEAAGFKAVEISSATVNATETSVLDEKLEVGEKTGNHRQANAGTAGKFAERPFQQYDGTFAFGSWPHTGTDSGKPPGAGAARQTDAHAKDPSTDGFDHDDTARCDGDPRSWRWRQK